MDGKVLLETRSRVAVAPEGNGGLYAALRQPLSPSDKSHTVLSDLDRRGGADLLVDLGTSSVGTVTDAAVLELDDTSATVLVSVEVAVTESADEPPSDGGAGSNGTSGV